MLKGRVVIIPFLHGKLTAGGELIEPDIDGILAKWLERHPEFDGPERDYRVIRVKTHLSEGIPTDFVRETAEVSDDLKAMGYLICEKLLNFLEVAERKPEWRAEIPDFTRNEGVFP